MLLILDTSENNTIINDEHEKNSTYNNGFQHGLVL